MSFAGDVALGHQRINILDSDDLLPCPVAPHSGQLFTQDTIKYRGKIAVIQASVQPFILCHIFDFVCDISQSVMGCMSNLMVLKCIFGENVTFTVALLFSQEIRKIHMQILAHFHDGINSFDGM